MTERALEKTAILESLSRADLERWFVDEMQGGSLIADLYRPDDDSPHAAVSAVYLLLDPTTRRELDLIVLGLLKAIPYADPAWPIDAVRELLLVIDPILFDSPHRHSAIDDVLALVAAEQDVLRERHTAYAESLQALLALGYRGSVRFWREAYEQGGPDYAELVAGALMEIDPSVALEFIASLTWNDAAESALFGILPTLIDDKGVVKAADVVFQHQLSWPAEVYELLQDFFAAEGLAVDRLIARQRAGGMTQKLAAILTEPGLDPLKELDVLLGDSVYTRAEVAAEVQSILMQWDPFRDGPYYSRNLLNIVSRFRSAESLLAISAFLEQLTDAARLQPQRNEEFGALSLHCLAVIQSWSPFVRHAFSADDSESQASALREKLVRCLHRTLSDAVAGRVALHVLVSHLREHELPHFVVAALEQKWATAGDCDVILQRYYSADSARRMMITAFDVAHQSSAMIAGGKLYQYKKALTEFDFTADSIAIVAMHDRLTATAVDAFVEDITTTQDLHDG